MLAFRSVEIGMVLGVAAGGQDRCVVFVRDLPRISPG